METYRVLLDANILMSKTLRDWILKSAFYSQGRFQVLISQGILDEWGNHTRNNNPTLDDGVIEKWRRQIIESCGGNDCILRGFPVPEVPNYPDPEDLHVHAAAIAGDVDALATNDKALIAYGRSEAGENLGYDIMSADNILMQLVDFTTPDFWVQLYLSEVRYWLDHQGNVDLISQLRQSQAEKFADYLLKNIVNMPRVHITVDRMIAKRYR